MSTEEEKVQIVKKGQLLLPGVTRQQFCDENNISIKQLNIWANEYAPSIENDPEHQHLIKLNTILRSVLQKLIQSLAGYIREDCPEESCGREKVCRVVGVDNVIEIAAYLEETMDDKSDWRHCITGSTHLEHFLSRDDPMFKSCSLKRRMLKHILKNLSLMHSDNNRDKGTHPLLPIYIKGDSLAVDDDALKSHVEIARRDNIRALFDANKEARDKLGDDKLLQRRKDYVTSQALIRRVNNHPHLLGDTSSQLDIIESSTIILADIESSSCKLKNTHMTQMVLKVFGSDSEDDLFAQYILLPPDVELDAEAFAITGQSSTFLMENDAVSYSEAMAMANDWLSRFNSQCILLSHNIDFDKRVIEENDFAHGVTDSILANFTHSVCTLQLCKVKSVWTDLNKFLPSSNSLDDMYMALVGKPRPKEHVKKHNAISDVSDLEIAIDSHPHLLHHLSKIMTPIDEMNVDCIDLSKPILLKEIFDYHGVKSKVVGFYTLWKREVANDQKALEDFTSNSGVATVSPRSSPINVGEVLSGSYIEQNASLQEELSATKAELESCKQELSTFKSMYLECYINWNKMTEKCKTLMQSKKRKTSVD